MSSPKEIVEQAKARLAQTPGRELPSKTKQALSDLANMPAKAAAPEALSALDTPRAMQLIRATVRFMGREATDDEVYQILQTENIKTPEQIRRAEVEAHLSPIDIGHYLLTGVVEQNITVIRHNGVNFVLRLRSSRNGDEKFIRRKYREAGPQQLSFVEGNTLLITYALAVQVVSWRENVWPDLYVDGKIDEEAFKDRVQRIEGLGDALFHQFGLHLAWFTDRVQRALTPESLGNG